MHKRGVNPNHTLSNRYNDADQMFLFKEGLSLIIRRLPFTSNKFLFSLVRAHYNFQKMVNGHNVTQSITWLS